ncbi:MBL fold metallo-hydrolase, partial [Bacillus cereus]
MEYLLFYIVHVLKMIVEIASFLFLRERNVVSL